MVIEKSSDYTTIIKSYTMKTKSWRRIQLDNPFDFHYELRERKGMLVNGSLHWLMSRSLGISSTRIISFDIVDEVFREVERPCLIQYLISCELQVLRGCLCVIHMNFADGKNCVDVWVMNEYGVKDCWTKIVIISEPVASRHLLFVNRSLKLLRFCRNGEVLMLKGNKDLFMYDPKNGSAKWVRRDTGLNINCVLCTETYIESLVSLKPMDQEQVKGKRKPRKRKNM